MRLCRSGFVRVHSLYRIDKQSTIWKKGDKLKGWPQLAVSECDATKYVRGKSQNSPSFCTRAKQHILVAMTKPTLDVLQHWSLFDGAISLPRLRSRCCEFIIGSDVHFTTEILHAINATQDKEPCWNRYALPESRRIYSFLLAAPSCMAVTSCLLQQNSPVTTLFAGPGRTPTFTCIRVRLYTATSPMAVVLNQGGVKKFPGGPEPLHALLYNTESFWTGMCTFQNLHQC